MGAGPWGSRSTVVSVPARLGAQAEEVKALYELIKEFGFPIKEEDKAKQARGGVQLVRLSFPPTIDVDAVCERIESAVATVYGGVEVAAGQEQEEARASL